ncbi:small integral membrane protein 5 [Xenopus laevis]|uniref:Small integral membrane protein 5 n=2 Tax=Xenopus laevis TaxID=8355 RepID=A0A1L8EUG2_XENLA|nr:small integral membrane protein 5 [Xenopus laevis]OCT62972.1 hypothetical protein XELAEV_18044066mg [Xenopus laevis]
MSGNDLLREMENVGQRLLVKLKDLPRADTSQILAFAILLIFIGAVLLMMSLACCYSCCNGHTKKHRLARVQPAGVV